MSALRVWRDTSDKYWKVHSHIFAWTDSTIVLNWEDGSSKRFKTYVDNCYIIIIKL